MADWFTHLKRVTPAWVKGTIRGWQHDLVVRQLKQIPGVRLGQGVQVDKLTEVEAPLDIGAYCNISASTIGRGTYICLGSSIRSTRVGRFCSIAGDVVSCLGTHPSRTWVSTHPAFFSTARPAGFSFVAEQQFDELRQVPGTRFMAVIGNDVWIGNRVMIMDGVTIGDGAIVGAGAVVTRDLDPYSVNVGVPARRIRYRFTPEQIQFLLSFRWWDQPIEWMENNASYFQSIEAFMDRFGGNNANL